ncbi:MAG: hypothetical protein COZ37_01055 [bacterium (Candidatus Ratteibacteria) CG_4_10_14_3_um_filter_41_18]|uniref:Flippase-like domain-containing protein n=4 Tax=Candidatus Ratteibacteria TaxID=2979319 RepID=A0A2M7E9A3_9BACT|nr:MAG: hypothetical protein AUJ76_01340 [Candidatus Omnitrophica bacterium CG1_02_41_171]PIV64322.1 MAG: hypothetical protein COS11_02725 [bacterium (Candidatus Ratteibacteria) CG01_land_8_20_14_3_00_40_19]PIW30542.1 MAG: hypothetical protein COW28_07940 [bacterium (Candidatus Ratteibacteria) CG15_BIG_FIL_POST_REV_8_21_14_020_41_12]PIW73997.1 MAG: hypothetical protein CO004_02985 [bacterium (Candidatus Ratteibacteria) CG_4_8_14_3_um_filter_41_36]PIX77747.1 MAG: hypothetical protein COZ37_01055
MKKGFFFLLRIFISFSLFFILLKFVNLNQFIQVLKEANRGILLLIILLNLIIVPFISYRWQIILSSQKLFVRLLSLIRLTFIGMFFNNFLPTAAGGDLIKGCYLVKGSDSRKIDLGASVLFDRIVGTISIIIMGLIATLLYYKKLSLQAILFIFLLSIFTLFLILFLRNEKIAKTFSRLLRFHKYKTLDTQSRRIYERFHRYAHSQGMLAKSIGISFITQIFSILMNYLIIISLGGKVSPFILFVYIPLIWVFSLFPSINGLGIREGAYVYFFKGIIGKETAFALSILVLALIFLNGIIGGIIHLTMGGKVKINQES